MKKSPVNPSSFEQYKTIIIALGVFMGLLIVLCLVLYIPYLGEMLNLGSGGGNPNADAAWQPSSCEELLGKAMEASYSGCQMIGSNEICYGNNDVSAQLNEDAISQFTNLGDTIPVKDLLTLSTAPMDLNHDVWGIAVFKLQANLEGTVPGQNVSFLVFGDTGLYNYSGDMYSIYFSTGIGSVTCNQVPDGLKVEVPEGSGVVFNANGAEIALEGDSVLTANPGESMTVTLLNGTGTVTADGHSQSLKGGEYLSVPLDEQLESNGPPSAPLPLPADLAYELCLLTEDYCDPNDPLSWITTPTTDVLAAMNQPTNTSVPAAPGEPTNTSVPNQPVITTPVPVITTPVPVITTPVPVITTPAPVITTPAPSSCGNVVFGNYQTTGNIISVTVKNNNAGAVILTGVNLSWDQGTNGQLDEIFFETKRMWGQKDNADSSASLSFSPAAPQRTLDSGATGTLKFYFINSPASALFSLTVHLDIGCGASK
ncbi:MAG: hypothetical protein ABFS17_01370 [Chloroflexota bacterium]